MSTKKPNFIYKFDEKEYTKEEELFLWTRLAEILLEIDEEANKKAA